DGRARHVWSRIDGSRRCRTLRAPEYWRTESISGSRQMLLPIAQARQTRRRPVTVLARSALLPRHRRIMDRRRPQPTTACAARGFNAATLTPVASSPAWSSSGLVVATWRPSDWGVNSVLDGPLVPPDDSPTIALS